MDEDPRHSYHPLVVADVIRETEDARSFVFTIPEPLRELFVYRAGQFLTFRVPCQEMELQRCYSLASSPDCDEPHKVTVKRVDEGRVSNWFNDRLRPGDTLRTLPPEGRFVLHENDRPIALFAGGSGITPVISLVKTALVTTGRRLRLVYANRDRESVIFRAELDALAERHPDRLSVVHHLDVDRGFLDVGAAMAHLDGWQDADFYICGPGPFMATIEEVLGSLGADRHRVLIERFVSPTDPDRAQPAPAPAPGGATPDEIVFLLEGTTHRVRYEAGKTLLETARDAGLQPSFACEEGYCSTCMARLKRGQVQMRANDALTEQDLADGFILTCQSVPVSAECEIDWDDY